MNPNHLPKNNCSQRIRNLLHRLAESCRQCTPAGLVAACLLLGAQPARSTMLLQYTFDDYTNSTFALDGSANPTNGYFKGATRTLTNQTPSGVGYGLNLVAGNAGVNNWLSVTNAVKLNNLTNFTLVTWLNLQANPVTLDRLIGKDSAGGGFALQINSSSATSVQLMLNVNNTAGASATANLNATNQWVFVAATYDGTAATGNGSFQNVAFYYGTPTNSVASLGTKVIWNKGPVTNNANELRIGGTVASGSDRTPPAWLDDVRIYDTVLSSSDLETIRLQDGVLTLGIATQPQEATVPAGSNVTFAVTANGIGTLGYQWRLNGANLAGATGSSYTLSYALPAQSGTYSVVVTNSYGTLTSSNAILSVYVLYDTAGLTNQWTLNPSDRSYLQGLNLQRGMAYNPVTANLVLANRNFNSVNVLDALTGADKTNLNLTGIGAGTYPINQVGIADDGAVYVGNLAAPVNASSNPFMVFRWINDAGADAPIVAFSGDPGAPTYPAMRWGDAMAVRGAGANTQILLNPVCGAAYGGLLSTNIVAMLQTANGTNFQSTAIWITNAPVGFAQAGLAFGPGTNTFFAKALGTFVPDQLYLVQFDLTSGLGFVKQAYSLSAVPGSVGVIGANLSLNLLAALENTMPDNVRLYSIANPAQDPVLLAQKVFTVISNSPPFGVGAAVFGQIAGTNYLFVLDPNNGIKAFQLNTNFPTPPALVWAGTNGNTWDSGNTTNWLNAGVPDKFLISEFVAFDSSATNPNVNVVGSVYPGQLTISGGNNYTFSGGAVVGSGTAPLLMNGSGAVTFSNANTYPGGAFIGAGMVVLNGSLSASTLTASGGTLSGLGSINSPITVSSGGTLAPGASSLGTLTINNSLNLGGSAAYRINKSGVTLSSDRVAGVSTVTYGGALNVTLNPGSDSLTGGESFTLFSAAHYSGAFASVALPGLATGLTWDTSKLAQNGSISVVVLPAVTVTPASTNVECGATLTFTASATGTTPLSYQWYDNLTNAIAGATNLTLTVSNAHAAQAGNYSLVITNAAGTGSAVGALTVVDTQPPVITLNGANPVTVECHSGYSELGATVTDSCVGNADVQITGSVNADSPGTYLVTYTATDGQNPATATRTVIVRDTTPPAILYCFTNLTLSAGANCQALLPDVTGTNYLVALDTCSSVTVTQMPSAGTLLSLGTNELVLTAFDASGNAVNSTNSVIVADLTAPVITLLGANPLTNECHAPFIDPGAIANDNCSGVVDVLTNNTVNPNSVRAYSIQYTANDASGNSATNARTVYIVDMTAPAVTCPGNISVTATNPAGANVSFTVTATDACDPSPTVVSDPPSGFLFQAGTNTVTSYAYDSSGNSNTCSFLVIVTAATAPPLDIVSGPDILSNGHFHIGYAGSPGYSYTVEATADLTGSWTTLTNFTLGPSGLFDFEDPTEPPPPAQFYRAK